MSKQQTRRSKTTATRATAPTRPTGLIAFGGVAALAIAGTTAWLTLGATSVAPSAQTPAPAQASASPATTAPAAPAQAASASAQTPASAASAARAGQTASTKTAASAPHASAAAADAPIGMAGQQAHIDPKTGQLRPAEHDDVATLNSQKGLKRLSRTAPAAEPQEFATESGAMAIMVPDEVQPYTVATKTADGKVVIEHVTGGKAAADKVRANSAPKGGLTQRKGEPNDR
jgi:hypothetical protein